MSMKRLIEGLEEAKGAKGDYAAVLNGDGPSALRDKMVKALMPEIFAKAWGSYSPFDIKGDQKEVAQRWWDEVSKALSNAVRDAAPY